MAIQIKHPFVSAKVDTLDVSKVQPSNWNADHQILLAGGVVVGRAAGVGQAAATEIPMGVTGQAILATGSQAAAQAAIGADGTQAVILAAAAKATPVDADVMPLLDSAAGNALKKVTWANIKATLKTYFDTLYIAVGGTVTALQNFVSSTASVVLAPTGAGTVYLRPNGAASAVGQTTIDSAGTMSVTGAVYSAGVRLGGAPDVVLEDQKAQNTDGGTINSGAWVTRTLNTEVRDPAALCTLAANTMVFATNGWVEWEAPGNQVEKHQSRLFNVTDAVVTAWGTPGSTRQDSEFNTLSRGGGAVVAGKTYRIEHRSLVSQATNGLGVASNLGTEIYTRVLFWRT